VLPRPAGADCGVSPTLRALLAGLLWLAPWGLTAQVLHLRSGAVLPCTIRKGAPGYLLIETTFGFQRIPWDQLRRVDMGALRRVEIRPLNAPPFEASIHSMTPAGVEYVRGEEAGRLGWNEIETVIFLP
jgi:hypothetical protein